MKQKLAPVKYRYAKSLQQAYERGYFTQNISRDDLMARITRRNPQLRWLATSYARALWDSEKGFICAITYGNTIPKFTILKKDDDLVKTLNHTNQYGEIVSKEKINTDNEENKVLARSWITTFQMIIDKGYEVDLNGLPL